MWRLAFISLCYEPRKMYSSCCTWSWMNIGMQYRGLMGCGCNNVTTVSLNNWIEDCNYVRISRSNIMIILLLGMAFGTGAYICSMMIVSFTIELFGFHVKRVNYSHLQEVKNRKFFHVFDTFEYWNQLIKMLLQQRIERLFLLQEICFAGHFLIE